MKIGLYMAYAPYIKEFTLKKEGLGRYLSFLLKAFGDNGDEVVIACPKWCIEAIDELMEENNIARDNIEFIVPKTDPALYSLYRMFKRKKRQDKRKSKGKMKLAAYKSLGKIIDSLFSTFSIFKVIMFIFVIAIVAIICTPIVILLGLLTIIYVGIKKILFRLLGKDVADGGIKRQIKKLTMNVSFLHRIYMLLRGMHLRKRFQEEVRKASALEVIRKANFMKEKPDIWYCHTAFWTEFNNIKGAKVVCVPDLVTVEFPFPFSKGEFIEATENVRRTIKNNKYFITYCDYLKNSLLINQFGKKSDDIVAIEHAQNNMLPFIDLREYFDGKGFKGEVNGCFVQDVIFKGLLGHMICKNEYLSDGIPHNTINIRDMDYLFYPSQSRGNKNMFTLLRAYKYILREKNIPIKLFLTCNYAEDDELIEFIYENRLQYDILSFNNISNQELAALYYGAKLVVNPTFYEGGFPFTFGEGMSVGTPSIMSDIPQVREVLQKYGIDQHEQWLFDSFSYIDLSKKIIFGLENRELLYKEQKHVYDLLKMRTWNDVGKEYVKAFQYFIRKETERTGER